MGLGSRYAHVRHDVQHDTVALRAQAVNAELWHEFREGQRVQTIDGLPGVVARVEDGPMPGAEHYVVELDRGLGGGAYTASQLTALGPAQASEVHTAAEDYPELGSILHDRPDIAKSASRHTGADTCEGCGRPSDEANRKILGRLGCTRCGGTLPHHVTVQGAHIALDGAPVDHGRGPDAHSYVSAEPRGDGQYRAALSNLIEDGGSQILHRGSGKTRIAAAKNAVRALAEARDAHWEDKPKSWHDKAREGAEY